MTALILLLKASLALHCILTVKCFCQTRDIEGIVLPGAMVLNLCFGIWEMGQ